MNDTRNLILAMVLSVGVLLAFDFFWMKPQQKAAQQRAQSVAAQQAAAPQAPVLPPQIARAQALSGVTRVPIDAPELDGSIALTGARLDDLNLKNYRRTIKPDSPEVTLLNPDGAKGAYYAVVGWTETGAAGASLPGPDTVWTQVSSGALTPQNPLKLQYRTPDGLQFDRTITVDSHFMFDVADTVTNQSGAARTIYPYSLIRRHGVPEDMTKSPIVHEGLVGVLNGTLVEHVYKKLQKGEAGGKLTSTGGWLGFSDHYWLTALIPGGAEKIDAEMTMRTIGADQIFETNFMGAPKSVAPGASVSEDTKIYSGAKRVQQLDEYKKQFGITDFEKAVDWGHFWFFTKPLFYSLAFFERLVGNFGLAILMLTVCVKAIFFPLVNQSYVAMSRMKKLQPKIEELRAKHGKDPQKMQQEMMGLYAREKVNPLAGCLPMLIPIPVFYALYKTLMVTIEMRHAPFFGWIRDLSARDPTSVFNLFGLLPFDPATLPLIGPFLAIGVLPLLYGLTMWALQSLSPPPPDPVQRQVIGMMPILFTFMFSGFAAGLVIYWTWSNMLSIAQQYVIMRRNGVETEFDKLVARLHSAIAAPSKE
jgi:YidC/Oxa1 family membrane protein insertase